MKKSVKNKIKKAIKKRKAHRVSCKSNGGFGYFLGVVGAAVYYVSTATGFWNGAWGIVKAFLWPAFLIFELLKFVGA